MTVINGTILGKMTQKTPPCGLRPDVKYWIGYIHNNVVKFNYVVLRHKQESQYHSNSGEICETINWWSYLTGPALKLCGISDTDFELVRKLGRLRIKAAAIALRKDVVEKATKFHQETQKLEDHIRKIDDVIQSW